MPDGELHGKTVKDYIYCKTCNTIFDFWKYDHDISDAGHEDCEWRYVTEEELKECVKNCEESGCFEEIML
jgi:hypothetical protein